MPRPPFQGTKIQFSYLILNLWLKKNDGVLAAGVGLGARETKNSHFCDEKMGICPTKSGG